MKKVNLLVYYIFFITIEEIIFSSLIFNNIRGFILIILASIPIAIILTVLSLLTKNEKVNKIITYIITTITIILFATQLIYYRIYDAILSVYSILNGKQVFEFMEVILEKIIENWYALVLLVLPLILLIILNKKQLVEYKRQKLKQIIIQLICLVFMQGMFLGYINLVNANNIYSNKNLYYNIYMPKLTANNMGLLTTMRLDAKRYIFKLEEKTIDKEEQKTKLEMNKENYNITDIDFDTLIQNEENEKIIEIHKYIQAKEATNKNEYTGIFKDKNIIAIIGESFSSLAINKELTPNLYKLYNEGFQFDNFYTPVFPVSTADGEYITDMSLLPEEGVWSFKEIVGNYVPYSYAKVFKDLGYSTNSYHNHTATFYERDKYIKSLGYDSFTAIGTGLEKKINADIWPESDYEMMKTTIDDYINDEKFLAYYMTVSGHLSYLKENNAIVEKNWELVKDLDYSEKVKGYLATSIELDKAIGELLDRLEKAGKLEDTVIVLSGDHYPYGLNINEINELSTFERDDTFEKVKMPLIIWSGSMKEPIKINKIGSSLDILPTVLNLFGINYDSRLLIGNDILSDASPMVIFSDRSFITDKGKYNAMTNTFIPNKDVVVEKDYVEKMNSIIYNKFRMSERILEYDYYRKIFENSNNEN